MSKVQLEKNDTPDLIAGKIQSAIHAYKQAGGELPARLMINPSDRTEVDVPAVRRVLSGGVQLSTSGSIEAGTIYVKPQGSIGV